MSKSELEEQLDFQLRSARLVFEREYQAVPSRRFRWDFAFPADDLLVEVQGGIWVKGGHSTGRGITRDCEKLNCATLSGWRTLAVTGEMIKSGEALQVILKVLEMQNE